MPLPSSAKILVTTLLFLAVNPPLAAEGQTKPKVSVPQAAKAKKQPKGKLVDINTATRDELKSLPGMTEAYADKIIGGRPYVTKARLVTRKVIPDEVYASIRGLIVAQQPKAPSR